MSLVGAVLLYKSMKDRYHADWEENAHPRGQPDNSGQFAPKNGVISVSTVQGAQAILDGLGLIQEDIPGSIDTAVQKLSERMQEEVKAEYGKFAITPKQIREQKSRVAGIREKYEQDVATLYDVCGTLEEGMDDILQDIFDNAGSVFDEDGMIQDGEVTDEGVLRYGKAVLSQLNEYGLNGGKAYRKCLYQMEQDCGKSYEALLAERHMHRKSRIANARYRTPQESEQAFSKAVKAVSGMPHSMQKTIIKTFNGIRDERFKNLFCHIMENCKVRMGDGTYVLSGTRKMCLNAKNFEKSGSGIIHELGHKMEDYFALSDNTDICSRITLSKSAERDSDYLRGYAMKMAGLPPDGAEYSRTLKGLVRDGEPYKPDTSATATTLSGMIAQLRSGECTIPINGKRKTMRAFSDFEIATIADMVQAVTSYTVLASNKGHPEPYFYNPKQSETELVANYATTYLAGGEDVREVIHFLIPNTADMLHTMFEDILSSAIDD